MRLLFIRLVGCLGILGVVSCGGFGREKQADTGSESNFPPPVAVLGYHISAELPHDTNSFTEGFLFHDGKLFESTGYVESVPGSHSWFGPVDWAGAIHPAVELNKTQYFGEGICFLGDRVYQLTYREKVGFIYDAKRFTKLGEFGIPGKEGWGMTTDGQSLLMSDGTSILYYINPATMQTIRKLQVTVEGVPADSLNELEYIRGYIYANRYTKDFILKIDPATGRAMGRIDCSALTAQARQRYPGALELNGIAYDSAADKVYITGKCWPTIYGIEFSH